jgi:DNA-binding CsgD family transcriptional regulator
LTDALTMARAAADPFSIAEALWYLGLIAGEQGNATSAARYFNEALALVEANRDRGGIAYCLACTGVFGVGLGNVEPAARLLGAAAALREAIGMIAGLPERAKYEQATAAARQVLGEQAFATAWSAGQGLPLDRAIAEAREITLIAASPPTSAAPVAPYGLTPRELDVLHLLVEGHSDKEIGAALFLSHRTVMRHVTGILTKLGVENRTAATHVAVRHGLV